MSKVKSVSDELCDLIDEVVKLNRPIRLIGKRANAVLVSEKGWVSLQEIVYLLSIPDMSKSINAGLATLIEQCSEANPF